MERFKVGQRVKVYAVGEHMLIALARPLAGVVVRKRTKDDGAWISLEQRSDQPGVHPFPENDNRGTHVLAFPEDCVAL